MGCEAMKDLKDQLNRIETAITGDPKMGHIGLVHSREDHERRLTVLERGAVYGAGCLFILGIGWTVWTSWPRK